MKKYVIDIKQGEYFNAGFKAKVDVDNILKKQGFEIKYLQITDDKSMKGRIRNSKSAYNQLKKILPNLENNSFLIFQYPVDLITYSYSKIIKKNAKKKNIKTVCLIHDINALHNLNKLADLYYKKMKKEIKFYNEFDFLISHNESMTKYLTNNGISKDKIINLGIFDYIVDKTPKINTKKINKVIIAGNLSKWKSEYLYQLDKLQNNKYNYELFGSEWELKSTNFIKYNGTLNANELPSHINYGFGLIWDGQSIDKISGSFGEYLKFNNPHKFSLYMATGIPVIVWKKSALANFVEKNRIGYTVNSLYELEKIFDNIKIEDYLKLQKNVTKIQQRVINGKYLIDSIKKIIDKI